MARPKKSETTAPKSKEFDSFGFFDEMETKNLYAENRDKFDNFYFINTGCFTLNAIMCGDMTGGFPSNRVIMLSGEEGTGKTLFSQFAFMRPAYLDKRFTFYMDTENSVRDVDLLKFGLQPGTFKVMRSSIYDEIREQMTDILQKTKTKAFADNFENIPRGIWIWDSQGNPSTRKSLEKSVAGEITKDMSEAREIKRIYSETVIDMGLLGMPMIVTNHVYDNIGGYGPKKKIAGGSGGLYNSSIILFLKKEKEVEGTGEDRVKTGTIFTLKVIKSRFVHEELLAKVYLNNEKGFNPWYGLHEFATRAGLLEDYSEAKHGKLGVVKPTGLGNGSKYVLINPLVDPDKWVICNDKTLHTKDGIGSIFEPLNEWVKENFKLKTPISLSLDADSPEVPGDDSDEGDET